MTNRALNAENKLSEQYWRWELFFWQRDFVAHEDKVQLESIFQEGPILLCKVATVGWAIPNGHLKYLVNKLSQLNRSNQRYYSRLWQWGSIIFKFYLAELLGCISVHIFSYFKSIHFCLCNLAFSNRSWAKRGEITFLQLQLDGTTCFQWRHSDTPSFLLFCV